MYQTGGYSIDVTKILAIKDPRYPFLGFHQETEIVVVEVVMMGGVTINLQYNLKDYRNEQDDNFSLMDEAYYAVNELTKKIKESKGYGKDS